MTASQPKAFITGNSSGLGRGLTEVLLERGWRVFGVSRRGCGLAGDLIDIRGDLSDFDSVPRLLDELLVKAQALDLVVLNAGVLGEIRLMQDTPLDDLQRLMDINVWSNKVVLDWLLRWRRPVNQILAISSGAAVLGNRGWSGYALSKASLNMLIRLYSHEFAGTHLSAIAPGLIDSAMMEYLCEQPDPDAFPALQRIRDARGTGVMPGPREAAERVLGVLEELREFESGSFVDIRQIIAPGEYEDLLKSSKAARRRR